MKKHILQIVLFAVIAATGVLVVAAQTNEPKKTREVKIYVIRFDANENPTLVAVKRRVDAATPLLSAFKAMINGGLNVEAETEQPFMWGFEDVSVSLKNKTAKINFSTEYGFEWGEPMRSYFVEAVEKTALQFPEVNRVRICVDGVAGFLRMDAVNHKKC